MVGSVADEAWNQHQTTPRATSNLGLWYQCTRITCSPLAGVWAQRRRNLAATSVVVMPINLIALSWVSKCFMPRSSSKLRAALHLSWQTREKPDTTSKEGLWFPMKNHNPSTLYEYRGGSNKNKHFCTIWNPAPLTTTGAVFLGCAFRRSKCLKRFNEGGMPIKVLQQWIKIERWAIEFVFIWLRAMP